MTRLTVNKTWKMLVGGGFVRSESGRVFPVRMNATPGEGTRTEQACRASRKDVRNAVQAACGAFPGWAGRSGFNRGQILYRLGEMMESRRGELKTALRLTGISPAKAAREVEASIDRCVYYAGWADKHGQVLGSVNDVAGPFFNFSVVEPLGTVGILAGPRFPLLGLLSQILPVVAGGNTVVALAPEEAPAPVIILGEMAAVSDFPPGVLNLLTGFRRELAPVFASHEEIRGLDCFAANQKEIRELGREAAPSIKRCHFREQGEEDDWLAAEAEGLYEIRRFLEFKTVWHPHLV